MTLKRDDLIVITKKEHNSDIKQAFALGLDEGEDRTIDLLLKTGRIRLRDLAGTEDNDEKLNFDSCRESTKEALKKIMK